ncbi:PEP-CTERM sorting domain-containing protein [bacterium]|nr:PEP-CTERM sorting domain-containing protein [bacterium]
MHSKFRVAIMLLGMTGMALAGPLNVPDSYPYRTQMSLDDGTSFYTADPTGGNGLAPLPHGYNFFQYPSVEVAPGLNLPFYYVPELMDYLLTGGPDGGGLVMRSAMFVDQISIQNPGNTQVYSPTDGYEVTGLIHGLKVVEALVLSTGADGARQFRVELELAPTDDQTLGATLTDEAHVASRPPIDGGGRITFYTDPTNGAGNHDFNPADGGGPGNDSPDDWWPTVDGRMEFETFGTVEADGSTNPEVEVLLDGAFANLRDLGVPAVSNNATVMKLTLILNEDGTSSAGSSAEAYINAIRDIYEPNAVDLTTYSGDGRIVDNRMSVDRLPNSPGNLNGGDMYMSAVYQWGTTRSGEIYNPTAQIETGWMLSSHDPIEFMTMIPEPSTMLLLGGSLVALVRRRRRNK